MDPEIGKDCRSGHLILHDAIELAPQAPGAYRFWSSNNRVIYVGKASNLRNRLKSHLINKDETRRHQLMIDSAVTVDWLVVTNEVEALILEDSLIKKHRPDFNIKMRDDKRYPLVRLDINDPYPSISVVRRCAADGAMYFGPYPSPKMLRIVLRLIDKYFSLRKCSIPIRTGTSRPCLHHQMNRCSGICAGLVDARTYHESVSKVRLLLSGRSSDLMHQLESEMRQLSDNLDFEKAARVRDQISAIRHISKGRDLLIPRPVDIDVIALQADFPRAEAECVMIRAGMIYGNLHWSLDIPADSMPEDIIERLLVQYYSRGVPIPGTILCSHLPLRQTHVEMLLGQLAGRRVCIRKPERGLKLRLLKLAFVNLQHHGRVTRQQTAATGTTQY